MRDEYVGDLGDFYKYGLLRHLTGQTAGDGRPALRLGVIWYVNGDNGVAGSERGTAYLKPEKREQFRLPDANLYDALHQIVSEEARLVFEVEQRQILPADTLFFTERVGVPKPLDGAATPAMRQDYREYWLERALQKTRTAELVFVDPDTGLKLARPTNRTKNASKYCFYDELLPLWQRGQSLVIYQHSDFALPIDAKINVHVTELQTNLRCPMASIQPLHFSRGSSGRTLFVVAQPKHAELLGNRLETFEAKWETHIRRVGNGRRAA